MEEVLQFLNQAGVYFLATDEGGQPRVRPFGAAMIYEGRIYFCTNNQKDVYKQMQQNPQVEFCACIEDRWLRLAGRATVDPRREARAAMLLACPGLKNMYTPDDGRFEVFYLEEPQATFASMSGESRSVSL